MRWRARSIRHAANVPPDGEAALRPVPVLGGMGLGAVELAAAGLGGDAMAKSGLSKTGLSKPGLDTPGAGKSGLGMKGSAPVSGQVSAHLSARSGGSKSGSGPGILANGSAKGNSNAESGQERAQTPQPSGTDGVPEDMATLVLDNSALGAGTAKRPDARPDPETELNAGLDPTSDAAIMLRVAAGDEASFNYLVGRYHRAIIHFLFRMVRNQAVAEELTQEVFLRVYRSRESYRAEAKFTTWLYRIATNLAVNHARDTKHERSAQTIYLDAPDEETGTTPDVADDEPSVEQKLMRDERMAAIRTHVMELPERQRMAVLMHKYQGMDYRQIGDVLKLSESATKSLLFRAYQTLRDKLKDFV
jgi:RNA polymerase sigma-70 factor, ECF subfamily